MEEDLSERLKRAQWTPAQVNPWTLPADQHGWRGLALPGNHKRKVYTVLHNEQVLVTALLLVPGERSVMHSHESGELSVHFDGEMSPSVSWHPPGEVHGGATPQPSLGDEIAAALQAAAAGPGGADTERFAAQLGELLHAPPVEEWLRARLRPTPKPRVLIDILFPPFKTTIEDPQMVRRTIVGQWYD
jgi:hypothetical protein